MNAGQRFDDWFVRQRPQVQWVVSALIVGGGATIIFATMLYAIYFVADWAVGLPEWMVLYPILLALFLSLLPLTAERDRLTEHDFAEVWRPLPQILTQWQTRRGLPRMVETGVRMIIGIIPALATLDIIQVYSGAVGTTPNMTLRTLGLVVIFLYWLNKIIPPSNSDDTEDVDG